MFACVWCGKDADGDYCCDYHRILAVMYPTLVYGEWHVEGEAQSELVAQVPQTVQGFLECHGQHNNGESTDA